MTKHSTSSGIIIGAVVGGALGAAAALLLAPKSGEELRSDIGNQLRSMGEKARELAGALGAVTKETAGSVVGHAQEAAAEIGSHVKEAASSVAGHAREAATDIGSHAREAADSVAEHANEAVGDAQAAADSALKDFNSMAPTQGDIVRLGKEMNAMPANSELERQGFKPDPAQ